MSSTFFYSEIKIKHKDLSVFNLDADNPDNNRVIIDNRSIIFTDVYSFEQRVLSLLKVEPDQQTWVDSQLVQQFGACLSGSAMLWWINEIDYITRLKIKS
jgi:hypothetical protein